MSLALFKYVKYCGVFNVPFLRDRLASVNPILSTLLTAICLLCIHDGMRGMVMLCVCVFVVKFRTLYYFVCLMHAFTICAVFQCRSIAREGWSHNVIFLNF